MHNVHLEKVFLKRTFETSGLQESNSPLDQILNSELVLDVELKFRTQKEFGKILDLSLEKFL